LLLFYCIFDQVNAALESWAHIDLFWTVVYGCIFTLAISNGKVKCLGKKRGWSFVASDGVDSFRHWAKIGIVPGRPPTQLGDKSHVVAWAAGWGHRLPPWLDLDPQRAAEGADTTAQTW